MDHIGGVNIQIKLFPLFFLVVLFSASAFISSLESVHAAAILVSGSNFNVYLSSTSGMNSTHGLTRLHTDGIDLKNTYGDIIYLRGAAVAELSWNPNYEQNASAMQAWLQQAVTWSGGKINCIRVCVSDSNTAGLGLSPTAKASEVDKVKDACVALGLYFFINWHGGANATVIQSLELNDAPLTAWHTFWANRYKNVVNYIGEEYWNEVWTDPFTNQTHYYDMARDCYTAIMAIDPTLLFFATSRAYSYNVWYQEAPLLGAQAVYCWDDYYYHWTWVVEAYDADGNQTEGLARMKSYLEPAVDIGGWNHRGIGYGGYPVLWVEGGFGSADNTTAIRDFYQILINNHNSFTTYMWWNSGSNLGLYNDTGLDAHGVIWKTFLLNTYPPSIFIPSDHPILAFQDPTTQESIYLNVTSGVFNATSCSITMYDNKQGSFFFKSQEFCTIAVTGSVIGMSIKLNGATWNGLLTPIDNHSYTISWIIPLLYHLLINYSPDGYASIPVGSYNYAAGTSITLTATAYNGSIPFRHWLINGGGTNIRNPVTFVMNDDYSYTPVFYATPPSSNVQGFIGSMLPYILVIVGAGVTILLARRH